MRAKLLNSKKTSLNFNKTPKSLHRRKIIRENLRLKILDASNLFHAIQRDGKADTIPFPDQWMQINMSSIFKENMKLKTILNPKSIHKRKISYQSSKIEFITTDATVYNAPKDSVMLMIAPFVPFGPRGVNIEKEQLMSLTLINTPDLWISVKESLPVLKKRVHVKNDGIWESTGFLGTLGWCIKKCVGLSFRNIGPTHWRHMENLK